MPQVFQVLRCYKCLVFQVHQTKKSIKWECKLCGEKQSIKRHYGIGTAKECRMHVQRLNGIRGEIEETEQIRTSSDGELENKQPVKETSSSLAKKESKWSNYVEEDTEPVDNNGPMYYNNTEAVLELPQKRKRAFGKKKQHLTTNVATCMEQKHQSPHSNKVEDPLPASKRDSCNPKVLVESLHPFELHNRIDTKIDSKHNISAKKIKAPTLNRNSKWAQYADEENQEQEIPCELIEKREREILEQSQNKTALFSQCDDSDIDSILDL